MRDKSVESPCLFMVQSRMNPPAFKMLAGATVKMQTTYSNTIMSLYALKRFKEASALGEVKGEAKPRRRFGEDKT